MTLPDSHPTPAAPVSDEDISAALYAAIIERRLPPGTKLGQDELGAIFGVSKTRIRPILYQLESRKLVNIEPFRGAFVASPSLDEARSANAVRQILEEGMIRDLAPRICPADAARLHELIDSEARARQTRQLGEAHRLTSEFHIALARLHGNPVLVDMLEQLVSRDSLAVALYQPFFNDDSVDEHRSIVEALEAHDAELAALRLKRHLQAVVDRLDIPPPPQPRNLASALLPQGAGRRFPALSP